MQHFFLVEPTPNGGLCIVGEVTSDPVIAQWSGADMLVRDRIADGFEVRSYRELSATAGGLRALVNWLRGDDSAHHQNVRLAYEQAVTA